MIRLSFTRSSNKKNSSPLIAPKSKNKTDDRIQKRGNKLAVVNLASSFLSNYEITSKTQNCETRSLNKTQENFKTSDIKTLNYSRRSAVLSIEDLMLLGKDLFDEPSHPKYFSQSPNITSSKKDYLIELKGRRTGIIKESKSRPSSKQKFVNTTKYAPFRALRPIIVTRKLKRKRNDTPSPWSANNY